MAEVTLSGWKAGLNTVQAIKVVREGAKLSLNEALAIVNRVLKDHVVVLNLTDDVDAEDVAMQLKNLGMIAVVTGAESNVPVGNRSVPSFVASGNGT